MAINGEITTVESGMEYLRDELRKGVLEHQKNESTRVERIKRDVPLGLGTVTNSDIFIFFTNPHMYNTISYCDGDGIYGDKIILSDAGFDTHFEMSFSVYDNGQIKVCAEYYDDVHTCLIDAKYFIPIYKRLYDTHSDNIFNQEFKQLFPEFFEIDSDSSDSDMSDSDSDSS